MVAPFDWQVGSLPRDPVPVDAIPDIGENQQIVFTEWMGRSPQDVEDQIGYPMTVALLGIPEVKTIRSYSMFGFSTIYVIFNEKAEFYWSRSRVLEKLNSLPAGTLPEGVQPTLGPDATALGQILWYTLEGQDPDGNPTGGWDLHELRTIQDWYVRYAIASAEGVSEVASIGGFVQEYQIDVDPDAMRAAQVSLADVFQSVRMSNVDVGARTIELNKAEYVIRGLGFIERVEDIEKAVVRVTDNVPITIKDIGNVTLGPALRRGALDKAGAEAVGGVTVVRYGFNPLEAIKNVKKKIEEVSPGLPSKVVIDYTQTTIAEVEAYAKSFDLPLITTTSQQYDSWVKHLRGTPRDQWPHWITTSQVRVVPFYDRTGVIYETLGTLNTALSEEILVTIIVILVMVMHLRSSILISALLPLAVLMVFIAMKTFGVDANIVALSGIAIAIGTMVDMGIIVCENILKHLDEADPNEDRGHVIFRASHEVAGAVLTAVSTTVVSFLPVFTMIAAEEFMPPLDEGSFLYMPTTMPHASIGEAMDVLQLQNKFLISIPEVESVVGKIGRADSPLDPAPISMIETFIAYKSEYKTDQNGNRLKFRYDEKVGEYVRDELGELIEDPLGRPFRQWREEIKSPNDIWEKITEAADIPGTTSAPKLQPIAARIVMLQSGMRAPMGMKIKGPDLETIERVALQIEGLLKQVPSVQASAVIADRIVGKPYLEIDIDRDAIKRYGLHVRSVQDVIEVAIGGRRITTTVEGRERYPVRVRYARELRDDAESLERILVPTPMGQQIPLEQLADIRYVRGPQVIKSEDTFLLGYVLFDMKAGNAEVDVVEDAQAFLQEKIQSGELVLPAGVSYSFAGNYENQLRSQKTLMVVLPLALGIIFLILYFQFKSVITTSLVFSGILIAWAGGFIMLWLYGTEWFLDFEVFGTNMRALFQVHTINLSVAVWVGFLALFGIASDDGVVIASYLDESFRKDRIANAKHAREATVTAGMRRVRPCLMTTATTLLALIPVLTSTGRGSDIMVPMAIPSFGGMSIEIMTMLVVPVLYCWAMEWKLKLGIDDPRFAKDA
ncbi:unnamed protein product [Ostreobium quekettii]|uniref:Acriflavin resistance protein n=1 Tax=Ostreobium quekettii TaxID=121088 RepID=A0A8S1IK03_9CHLO|nr:unnamed protein product [Ostreobium quekettii]